MIRRLASLAAVVLAGAPATALATDGNLYLVGASNWSTSHQFTANVLPGAVWQVQAPALAPALTGNHWEMNWACTVPGSEIAEVHWSALRTQAASSLAIQVTGDRVPLWSEPDGAMPQSPAAGRAYGVGLPGGQCNVHLALRQVETRDQHARGYFIDNPRVLVRDLAAPNATLRGVSTGWRSTTSGARVDWNASDNFGGDGIGGQRVVIGGRVVWSGAPGMGDHGVDVPLAAVPDGAREVLVQVDGDGTGDAVAAGTIHVDNTPPQITDLAGGATAVPGGAQVSWRVADGLSGVGTSTAEINTATDGSDSGEWRAIGGGSGPGRTALTVGALAVADGLHAWRVRAADIAGNVAITRGAQPIVVDTTAPRLELDLVPAGWVSRAEVEATLLDNLQASIGTGAVEVAVNDAADGSENGAWRLRGRAAGAPGRRVVGLDLAGLESGRHAVLVTGRNGEPFGDALVAQRRTSIRVDRTPPVVARATAGGGGTAPLTVAWVAEDAHSGITTATVQWRDGGTWRSLGVEGASEGGGSMVLDTSALPAGDRAIRVVIADAAGNTAARAVGEPVAGGVGTTAGAPVARLVESRLTLVVQGARPIRRAGRTTLVRRVVAGSRLVVAGRLVDRSGRGVVGAQIEVRGHRGRLIGRGLTRSGGRFRIEARPVAGGPVRVGVRTGGRLLPRRPSADLRLEVRPRIRLSATATRVGVGEEVLFTGRVTPSPRDLGLGDRKGVVLEWLDPVRQVWRPVVNARMRADGTFAIPWSFGLSGLTIPMRVVVPDELGWPLLPVRSGVLRVEVR